MEQDNKMKRFIRPSYLIFVPYGILTLLFLGMALFFIIETINTGDYFWLIFGALQILFFVAGLIWILEKTKVLKSYFAQQKDFVDSGKYNLVSEEFNSADVYIDGKLRMSNCYVFGKHSGRVLEYSDIKNIYQYIHKTNFTEDERKLKVITASGEEIILCKLKTGGKSDDELKKAIIAMLIKNNQIRIGYL